MAVTRIRCLMLKETKDFIDNFEPKLPSKATQAVAHFISFVFHPVFMPTILAFAMYHFVRASFADIEPKQFGARLLMIFMTTAFFPILSVFIMKGLNLVENIHLYKRRDRLIPLIISMIFYYPTYYFLKAQGDPFVLQLLLLGSYWNIVALFLVNIFFKVSMHTTGAGGMLGMLIVLLIISPINLALPLFLGLFIAGFIGTARMLLRAHRQSEIWLGYVMGMAVQLAAYWYLS